MANPNMFSLAWGPERLGKLLQTLEGLESGERLVTVAGAGRLSFAPWSDHPWPRGLDGINHRWKAPEEPSPAEKYATAFGLDVRAFQDEISRTSGKNASTRAATDIGLQDAWGRASIEVEPPQCAVTKNGVTFYPRDIKALVSQLYFQSNRVVERRSTVRPRDVFRYGREYRYKCTPKRNEFYWVDNGGCKDIWPSMFHDVLLNTMGRFQLPVLVRFAGEQAFVPIRAYRVREMRSLSINETIAEFGSSFRDRYNPNVESHGSVFTLEIDWVLSSMEDLDDDLLTMRTTLRYAFETWTRLFAREGAWLLSNASATLTPVSLEVPLPLLPHPPSTQPTAEDLVVATISSSAQDDLPWYLVSAAIVAFAVLLIELLVCSLRLKAARTRSPNKRRGAGPRADTATISTLSSLPGVSLWDEQLLMNRYIPAKQITVVRLLGGGAYGVSRNILLSEQRGRLVAKLCDFGVSRSQSSNHSMTTGVGTSRWLAPEVILGGGRYDEACDIYSFGVVLTELDTHEVPFHDVRGAEGALLADVAILQRVAHERLQPPVSASCPSALASLARACMAFDASERPSAQEMTALPAALSPPSSPRALVSGTSAKVSFLETLAQPSDRTEAKTSRPSLVVSLASDQSALDAVRTVHSPRSAGSPSFPSLLPASPRASSSTRSRPRGAWSRKLLHSGWTGPADAVFSLVACSVASHAYHIFLRWHETRTDVAFAVLSDPLHTFFEPVDCSLALSVLVYGSVVLAFYYSLPRPDHFFEYMQTHTLVITLRMLALYLTPLEAPPGTVPLVDPIAHPDGAVLVRDLFFSGHTAATFTIFIGVRRQDTRWRLFFGLSFVVTAMLVVLMKAHYVLDVLAAPCFVHSAHSLVVTARETATAWLTRPRRPSTTTGHKLKRT
ncbi:hypothetical protein ATCC90586_009120 [Pythium insidiosum]|nr:hypothetical protein ATCC90586_009120 [Pythium insidiosum]